MQINYKRFSIIFLALFLLVSSIIAAVYFGFYAKKSPDIIEEPQNILLPQELSGLVSTASDHGFGELASSAKAALIYDANNDKILFAKNPYEKLPIASISKLITALVFLDHNPGLSKTMTILPEENVIGGRLQITPEEEITVKDLFYISLLGSANNTALALMRSTGLKEEDFVEEMNRKAIALNMHNSFFVEPTGLDDRNKSSAYDVALLAKEAFSKQIIREATTQKEYQLKTLNTKREHTVKNTNELITNGLNFTGSKTGYLNEAGYCLVVQAENQNKKIIAVVLGSPSKQDHFQDIKYFVEKGMTVD